MCYNKHNKKTETEVNALCLKSAVLKELICSCILTSSAIDSTAAVSMNISLKGWLWLLLTVIGWVMSKVHNHNKLIKKL